jgi:polysaccharide export outer membrane protein
MLSFNHDNHQRLVLTGFRCEKKYVLLPLQFHPSMKNIFTLVSKPALIYILIAVLLGSCVPQKKIKYLQKQQAKDTTSILPNKRNVDYKIQIKDYLYIRVFALDEKAFIFFNKQSGSNSYNDFANDASIYLNGYSVNSDGYIDFPIIGKVYVKALTVDQVKDILQKMIGEYLTEVTVVVKMVNFRVTMIGEVVKPGEFTIYKDDLNLFEALALAGDLTEFANRTKVALIRQVVGGSQVHYIDLTSEQILSSKYYYLQPNDIIYVAPLGYKRWGLGSVFPWAMIFSSISMALLLINYFK